jgi:DNA repair protein RecO (recombination protein O)
MLQKSRAVILHQLKYTDSGIIVQAYTREFGRVSVIVKGMRSKKSGKHNALFQPMSVLDLVFYQKESRSVQVLREFSVSYSPLSIYSDIRKSTIAMFLGEMMTSVLREESPNQVMYDFIETSVKYFDLSQSGYSNFHISFLIGLTGYLGFGPGPRSEASGRYFDFENGTFAAMPPVHGNYADPGISSVLAEFLKASFDEAGKISLRGAVRNEVLETIIKYYSTHLPGLKKINSLEVLKEIFK